LLKIIGKIWLFYLRVKRRILMYILKSQFKRIGTNVLFDPFGSYTFKTIEFGDNVFIGRNAIIRSVHSNIVFGSNIMLGPNVQLIGGDHNFRQIGQFMFAVKEKQPGDDLPISVEDDVWIGAGAVVLKGVTICRGSVVAAGAVVTKNIPPYSIFGGLPAKVIGYRFNRKAVIIHEEKLYAEGNRLILEDIEHLPE